MMPSQTPSYCGTRILRTGAGINVHWHVGARGFFGGTNSTGYGPVSRTNCTYYQYMQWNSVT